MKKIDLEVTKQNNLDVVRYELKGADVYDERVADKVSQISSIVAFQYSDEDGKRSITSYVKEGTSLQLMFKKTLDKKTVLAIMSGLASAFEIGAQGVPVGYIVRDTNYIYVNEKNLTVKCLLLPIKQDVMQMSELPKLFREVLSNIRYDDSDKDNYAAKLITLVNSDDFSAAKLKDLANSQLEQMGYFVSKDNGLTDMSAGKVPATNNDIKVNKIGVMNNMMGQPPMPGQMPGGPAPMPGQPPMMGQPGMMPGRPAPMPGQPPMMGQTGAMPGRPTPMSGQPPMMGQPAPMPGQMPGRPAPMPGQPPMMGQPGPMPGRPAPMPGQPPMMGQPGPMPGQMPGRPAPMPGQPPMMGQPGPMPGAPAPMPGQPPMMGQPGPMPGAPAPIPAPTPAPVKEEEKPEEKVEEKVEEKIEDKIEEKIEEKVAPAAPVMPTLATPTPVAPTPVAPTPVAPAAPTPVAPAPVAPAAPTPVAPAPVAPTVPSPAPVQEAKPGEFTMGTLAGQLGSKPVPHIIRKNTGEAINITKPEFAIGKSKTKADYAIENNSAISRVHCIIVQRDGVNYIKDNNSTNHTYVNGVELEPGKEVLLKNKTVIQLGDEEFTFLLRKGE